MGAYCLFLYGCALFYVGSDFTRKLKVAIIFPLDCLKLLCNASLVVRSVFVFVLRTKELSQSLLSSKSEPCDASP